MLPVLKAAERYGVPETTLRDRVSGRINIDCCTTGKSPILSLDEENKVVRHLLDVARIGYAYNRQEIVQIASDYTVSLGKRTLDKPLTLNWFHGFMKRWPELRVVKPRSLEISRAKSASHLTVQNYFNELEQIIEKYKLKESPHLIYNVDEKGISTNHTPSNVVAGREFFPQSITMGKSQTITIIGCGSASGVSVPPFFVFPGKRMMPDLMKNSSPGANGTMSDSGWSNADVFRVYLKEHFLKFIPRRDPNQYLLLIFDGHKSHVSVELVEWAKEQNIILFVLPAHTSHILQPLDVACYGPFQRIYNNKCQKLMRTGPATITRYDVCQLACETYTLALSPSNLLSGFCKTGIYPIDRTVISKFNVMPAEVFQPIDENVESNDVNPVDAVEDGDVTSDRENTDVNSDVENMEIDETGDARTHSIANDIDHSNNTENSPSLFLNDKFNRIISVKSECHSKKKVRNCSSRITSGQAITESPVQQKLADHFAKSSSFCKKQSCKSNAKSKYVKKKSIKGVVNKGKQAQKKAKCKQVKVHVNTDVADSQQQGPSHIYINESQSSCESVYDESELCCVCKQFKPKEQKYCMSLIFVRRVKCSKCDHVAHLGFCTKQKVIRRGDEFICIHCT